MLKKTIIFFIISTLSILWLTDSLTSIFPRFQKKTEFDILNKENPKLVFMFNEEIDKKLQSFIYKKSTSEEMQALAKNATSKQEKEFYEKMNKDFDQPIFGHQYSKTAAENAKIYFESIESIESFAEYGVTSMHAKNRLQLKIVFSNNIIADRVYTGIALSGIRTPNVLFKVLMENGRVSQVFTNGIELNNPPDFVRSDIYSFIKSVMNFELVSNQNKYFPNVKSKEEIKEEWEDIGTK